jgi:hypothetical protein
MKKNILFSIVAGVALFASTGLFANTFSVGTDIMSRYIWRGTDFGNSPSIQPTLEYSTGNLSIGTWGAFSTEVDIYQELDLYVSYTMLEMLTIGVTDYFFPSYKTTEMPIKNNYFNYDADETGHIFEANLAFNCKKIPLTISANIAFYGGDKLVESDGETSQAYSTYIEAAYSGKLNDVQWNTFIGFTPTEGLYGNTMGVVNLGLNLSKEVKITETYSLPVNGGLIVNPQAENIFLVFGISL